MSAISCQMSMVTRGKNYSLIEIWCKKCESKNANGFGQSNNKIQQLLLRPPKGIYISSLHKNQ